MNLELKMNAFMEMMYKILLG